MLIDEQPKYDLITENDLIPAHSGGSREQAPTQSPNHPEYAKIMDRLPDMAPPARSPNHPEYAKIFDKLD